MVKPALSHNEHPSAAQMAVGDTYITYRLVKEGLRGITGVPAGASFLTTVVAIGVLAGTFRRLAAPALKKVSVAGHPTFAGTTITGAVLREVPRGVAGAGARDKPFIGTIITASLLVPAIHLIGVSAHKLRAALAAFGRIWW